MTVTEIEKKAKLVTGEKGKPVEVILPYSVYKHLFELEMSMEIFNRKETQASIKRAKADIKAGRAESFLTFEALKELIAARQRADIKDIRGKIEFREDYDYKAIRRRLR